MLDHDLGACFLASFLGLIMLFGSVTINLSTSKMQIGMHFFYRVNFRQVIVLPVTNTPEEVRG